MILLKSEILLWLREGDMEQTGSFSAKLKSAWAELEMYQKIFLVGIPIVFILGLIFPSVMEILLLPFAFVTCSG